ncbi:GGDEF domain-containing protein [Psychrosphaera sp. 1_MG-2023]|uniref:GGDEF domain-containing protein n=1 Tax=Psychrosphaera sp. 1_MG-2023 TaxID=3062643 RepID=UPI0026E2C7EE|nr:GGDEF domain-containing protein [Psychrosphaera sp. 1_MG-2023]MDO6719660.1 GGDEF domain-containing protein [Psychrosphaera sp. 1_MG-2023]
MTAELIGQLTFIIVILCSSIISAAFMMFSPVAESTNAKIVTRYFSLFFFLTCFAFCFYLFRPFIPELLSILIANLFFLGNLYALKFGLRWRISQYHHIHQCPKAITHISIFVVSQVGLYLFLDDSQLARSTNHALNSIYILATSLTIIWHDKTRPPTFGEKSLKIAVYFAIMCFVTVPIAYVYIPNNYQYMSVLLLLQVLSVLMMMGGLQSLLMSDTINQHYELSIRDPLTGIYNRRYFFDKVKDCHMDFDKEPHSIIMCDIDFFKRINDNYGHDIGDLVIVEIATLITRHTGELGIAARFGGEEFTILLHNHGLKKGLDFAEELRHLVRAIRVNTHKGQIRVTASFGVAEVWDIPDIDLTIKLADQALLAAKANGRNQVCAG